MPAVVPSGRPLGSRALSRPPSTGVPTKAVLGAAAGYMAGAPEVGAAIITGGQTYAQSNFMRFSRGQEQAAGDADHHEGNDADADQHRPEAVEQRDQLGHRRLVQQRRGGAAIVHLHEAIINDQRKWFALIHLVDE